METFEPLVHRLAKATNNPDHYTRESRGHVVCQPLLGPGNDDFFWRAMRWE